MDVQFLDVVNFLVLLHPDYGFVFLFDNFVGPGKKRVIVLGALSNIRSFVGSYTRMK